MPNLIVILVLLAIAVGAIFYILRSKKRGCCGSCPYSKECGKGDGKNKPCKKQRAVAFDEKRMFLIVLCESRLFCSKIVGTSGVP